MPNVLTALRLLAAPCVVVVFLILPRPAADWAALLLFAAGGATDWLDGRLARAWQQQSALGAMLDPIADKAMVGLALLAIVAGSSLGPWVVVPAALILFREFLVSGLREGLGAAAGTLRVTPLAKWKTAAQMAAIATLLAHGIFEHHFGMALMGLDAPLANAILSGRESDPIGLAWKQAGTVWSGTLGLLLVWLAAGLTLITGWDYWRKAVPLLKETA